MLLHKKKKFLMFILLSSFVLAFSALAFFTPNSNNYKTEAAGNSYYVSLSGNDSNSGSLAAPFKTFTKAVSVLGAGDSLFIMPGTYSEQLKLNKSGASGSPITVKPYNNGKVVLNYMVVSGSYYQIQDIEVGFCSAACIDVSGNNVTFDNMDIHNAQGMGIAFAGDRGTIRNSEVYLNAYSNKPKTISHGWASGIKIRLGTNTTIENNLVYNNYGEGIATRGVGGTVRGNKVYDNYSINIYIDNSKDFVVEKNFTYCTSNAEFYKSGGKAIGIALAEEYYAGWGAILGNIKVKNNIVANCGNGFYYTGAEPEVEATAGFDNIQILNNTFWGSTNSAIYIENEPYKTRNSVIANNILQQSSGKLINIKPTSGVTAHHNLFVVPPTPTVLSSNASGTGDIKADPKITTVPGSSPTVDNFKLLAGSPAINAGAAIAEVTDDYNGAARSSIDIGALEYGGTVVTGSGTCGNGVVNTPNSSGVNEVCDDGNTANNDQCSNDCRNKCTAPQIWNGSSCASAPVTATCKADYNINGLVDVDDFSKFAKAYNQSGINCNLDLVGGDCRLDGADFSDFSSKYKDPNACKL